MNACDEDRASVIERFLAPRSIAVVGASSNPSSPGGRPFTILRQHNYAGSVYLVNPSRDEISGTPCYRSVADLPEVPDLALIAVPAHAVTDVLAGCRDRGIKAAYVISSGFSEARAGTAGPAIHARLDELLREGSIRVAGPNAEGIYNVIDDIAIGFTPAVDYTRGLRERPAPGNVAVVSQSGGLGFGIFNLGLERDIRFSHVISAGNEADLDVLDFVEYLVDDPATTVIALFLEGIQEPLKLERLALRAYEKNKVIVVAKVGRFPESQLAAVSHTGHMTGPSELYSAMFRRCGIVEALDLEDLVDAVAALSCANVSAGRNIGIVTGSGGTGAWLADICRSHGLAVPALPEKLQLEILSGLPYYASARNPVDVTAGEKTSQLLADVVHSVVSAPEVDSAIFVQSMMVENRSVERAEAIHERTSDVGKPVLAYSYTTPARAVGQAMMQAGIPWFPSQRGVVRALSVLAERGAAVTRLRQTGEVERILAGRAEAPDIELWDATGTPPPSLTEGRVMRWLREAGAPVPNGELVPGVRGAEAAVRLAGSLGYPVALKVQSPLLPHKADAGVIALDVRSAESVGDAYEAVVAQALTQVAEEDIEGVLVQAMASPGYELLLGVTVDPGLGAFLSVGAGGGDTEVYQDVTTIPAPCTTSEVRAALSLLRCRPRLVASDGAQLVDVAAFCELAVLVSELGHRSRHQLRELDLNPVLVHAPGNGVTVVDGLASLSGGLSAPSAPDRTHVEPSRILGGAS